MMMFLASAMASTVWSTSQTILLPQQSNHLGHGVLTLSNGQAVAGNDDDVLGVGDGLDSLVNIPDGGSSGDLHGFASAGVSGTETSEDNVGQRPVHGDTHDVGEDGSTGSDERADHGHQVVVQHEALGTESPARVGVEDGDDDRHVGSTNSHGESDSHHTGQGGGGAEHGQTDRHAGVVQEVAHGSNIGGQQTGIECMAARQHQRVRTEITVELAIGNQRPSEGHTSDESSQEGGGLDHGGSRVSGEAREMVDVGGHAGQHGGHADQGVEGSHQLGQVGDLDPLSDGCSNTSSGHGSSDDLSEDL